MTPAESARKLAEALTAAADLAEAVETFARGLPTEETEADTGALTHAHLRTG